MSSRARTRRLPRTWAGRPLLTIDQVLAWADAHFEATGEWPAQAMGRVLHAPYDVTWKAINSALGRGNRGLPGGFSLAELLAERRDVRPALSFERILAWADAHHAATGEWPTQTAGPVLHAYRETWHSLDDDLRAGRRGLAGGMTLARLLAAERGARNVYTIELLTIEKIMAWADAHHAATGNWPSHDSGPVVHAPGEYWAAINGALTEGRRGLLGGTSLTRVLVEHRGRQALNRSPDLSVPMILAWADAFREANGRWPIEMSGPVDGTEETWVGISGALARGLRGLPGGSSLARLLAEHRNARNPKDLPPFTFKKILAWADAHHAATGRWPSNSSGPVLDAPDEDWRAIDSALRVGHRGLRGDTSLSRLLEARRQVGRPLLTLAQVREWGRAHRAATGRWPDAYTGPVVDAPGEDWLSIDAALRRGHRGLPGEVTLMRLFGRSNNPAAQGIRPKLSMEQIMAWAEAYRASTGRWPTRSSGEVVGAPGEKWVNIDMALQMGRRGLPSGMTLLRLFSDRRGPEDRPASKRRK